MPATLMIKKIELLETQNAVHFECLVNKWVCNKCKEKREYERPRERCLVCNNPDLKFIEDIKLGHINKLDENKWSCSCVWGSWWRFGSYWINNYPNTKCRHYKKAFKEWKKRIKNEKTK